MENLEVTGDQILIFQACKVIKLSQILKSFGKVLEFSV